MTSRHGNAQLGQFLETAEDLEQPAVIVEPILVLILRVAIIDMSRVVDLILRTERELSVGDC